MKIGFIGTRLRNDRVNEVIKHSFSGVSVEFICDFPDSDYSQIAEAYRKNAHKYDAILLSGELPRLWARDCEQIVPTDHIHKETSTLLSVFGRTMLHGFRIDNCSIDNYSEQQLSNAYAELGLSLPQTLNISDLKWDDPDYVPKLYHFHLDCHLKTGGCCLTAVANVYRMLRERGIPTESITPTDEAIISSIQRLMLQHRTRLQEAQQLAVIVIEVDYAEYDSHLNDTSYRSLYEGLKIQEQVYRFAQQIEAAIMQDGNNHYTLFTSKAMINSETNHLKENSLFDNMRNVVHRDMWMGIGFGETAIKAKSNAEHSLEKAKHCQPNATFFSYPNGVIVGPFFYLRSAIEEDPATVEKKLKTIADMCGINVQTIGKFQNIVQEKQTDSFTIEELSEYFGIGKRTMYRIVEKLMAANYVKVDGPDTCQKYGRPRMKYKIKL